MAISIITWAGNSASDSASSRAVSDDAAMQSGDVRYVSFSISNETITTPSGWALVGGAPQVVATTRRIYVFRRIHAGGSEPASTTFTFSGTANHSMQTWAARGADTTTPDDVNLSADSATSGTSVTSPTRTTVTNGAVLVSIHAKMVLSSSVTMSLPGGMTSIATGAGTGSAGHAYRAAYETIVSAGATGTRTSTSSDAGNAWGAAAFAIRPRVEVTGTVAATLGGLTATVAGVRGVAGTVSAPLGALTATVAGTGTPPPIGATASLGALTATVSGVRATTGTVSATLGALSATVVGTRTTAGAVSAALGGLTAQVIGGTTVDITTLTRTVVTQRTRHELWCVARIMSASGPPTLLDVDPIEWSGLSWTDELSRPQTLQASVSIPSLPESILQRLQDMANLPSELHLYRNGRLVFAGQWVGALAQGETLTLNAMGLLGYLRYREIGINQTFSQVDQAQIVKTLIDQTQADPWSHFGLDTSGIVDTGQARDATYRVIDGNNLAQRVEEMGRRDFGFDIEVDPQTRQVLLWHPRKGVDRSEGEGAIVFDARNVTDPTVAFSVAPGDVATITIAVGTSDKEPVLGFGINAELGSRFGVAHVAQRFDGVSEQLTIDDHAWAMLDARDQALIIPGPDVRVDDDTDLDLWAVGDTVAYEPNDTLGIRGAWRVRKRTVKVDQTGQETVTVEFA
ncbi:MAG: hypothetical protein AB7G23_20245 [Vicinamibacterales bacterium]